MQAKNIEKIHIEKAGGDLYCLGNVSLLDKNIVAIIGKRDVSEGAIKTAKICGKIAAECGAVVLNGLAIGCDTAALEGALDAGGKCIAVMPCGLDYVYPKCNDALVKRILDSGGLLVSEYPQGSRPEKWKFVARDKIQAQLSDKIVVVEADVNGGTMYAVKEGMKTGKGLACIVRQSVSLPSGNKYMIENGAEGLKGEKALERFVRR